MWPEGLFALPPSERLCPHLEEGQRPSYLCGRAWN